jgi:4-hydroxy-2-oxovalerate aldolase
MSERSIRITDTTLRDGDHAISHQFTAEQVQQVARALDQAGVPVIEVTHGDGLAGSSLQYGLSRDSEERCIAAAAEVLSQASLACLLIPGVGTRKELRRAAGLGMKVVRVATHCTEADIAEQHIKLGKDMGLEVHTFLMMSHMVAPERLAEQALLMAGYGADCVYVVDSAGALLIDEVSVRVRTLRGALPATVEVGFHAHNNLGLAIANTLAGIDAGATRVDGTTCGLGAGAGNAPTEVLVAVLDKLAIATGIDLFRIMDAAEEVVRPIMPRPPQIDRASLTIGYAGVYSTFLLHAYRAAARFGVDPREILMELGRRKAVGGQEDMILDVAVELAERAAPARS